MGQFMSVGYTTLVDHLTFYSRVPCVYNGLKYTCMDSYPEIADMLQLFIIIYSLKMW